MDDKQKTKKQPGALKDAIRSSIVMQFILGFSAAMVLDGGMMFSFFKIICIAYWVFLPLILRRFKKLTKWDLFYIRWGIILNIPLMYIALILRSVLKIH